MDKTDLDPVADILMPAYLSTASYSRQFRDEYGEPPTLFAKIHHMRSLIQATINKSDRFKLDPDYSEFGRVQFWDGVQDRCYLVRSDGSVSIERAKHQGSLFNGTKYLRSDVILLVQFFHKNGMDLSVAGTRQQVGKRRLEPSGIPDFIGTWPFSVVGSSSSFNQGEEDAFGELGDLPETGEDEDQ